MSTEKLQIGEIEQALSPQVLKILDDFYKKNFDGNGAKLAEALGTYSSNVKRWLEGTQLPAWVLLYIWQKAPRILRDRIIDRAIEQDPTTGLTDNDAELVRDFAEMLKTKRARELKENNPHYTDEGIITDVERHGTTPSGDAKKGKTGTKTASIGTIPARGNALHPRKAR